MKPGSPEWARLVTASKVAAILGVSPWESQRSIWHKMHGDLEPEPQNESMARGHYLEPAILAWFADQHPELEAQSPMGTQRTFTLGDWAAATPDGCYWTDDVPKSILPCGIARPGVLVEAKSAAIMDDWGDEGTDVIPAYYLVQVYWQLHLAKAARCYVPVIGPRLRFAEYVVEYDAEIGADLEARMRAFYDTLAADEPPPLDDSVATFDVIRKRHKEIDTGAETQLDLDVAVAFVEAMNAEKDAKDRARLMRATVIAEMGVSQYAMYGRTRIARRQADGPDRVKFVPIAKTTSFALTESEQAS